MFYHNFKYSLKILLKNKSLIFWTFAFPILLGTLFNMAFSNIEKSEKLSIIDIAIINSDEFDNDKIFKETMQTLSDDNNKNKIFNITYTDISKAKKMLLNEEITGYLKFNENNIDIIVNSSGINETILRSIVDEIEREKEVINTLVKKETEKGNIDYTAIYNKIALLLNNSNATLKDISNQHKMVILEISWLTCKDCIEQDNNFTEAIYSKYSTEQIYRYYLKSKKDEVIANRK